MQVDIPGAEPKSLKKPIVIAAIAAIASMIAAVAAIISVDLNPQRTYAAENFASSVFAFGVAAISTYWLWKRCRLRFWVGAPQDPLHLGVANFAIAGNAVFCLGFGVNRQFWLAYRMLRSGDGASADQSQAALFLQYGMQGISALTIGVMVVGMMIFITPWARHQMPLTWPIVVPGTAILLWLIGYQAADLVGV